MNSSATHPDRDRLSAFALGQLDPDELAQIAQHVLNCDQCCAALRKVPDDTLVGQLREAHTPPVTEFLPNAAGATGHRPPRELIDHPRYRLIEPIGYGGMGVVYKAEHRLMERPVALKVIRTSLLSNSQAVERFRLEVKTAARLTHANIVAAHDAEQAGNVHFLVMEFVDGVSLARLVEKRGPLGIQHACHYIRQAAAGLQHAFEQGMVHRDIKPQNLMLSRKGQVKVLDFGLARFASEQHAAGVVPGNDTMPPESAGLTLDNAILGTPDYIAPEQISDPRTADIRADIYSLGCTLYYLLTARAPFAFGSLTQKMRSHVAQPPPPLATLRPELPTELVGIVDRMMAKNPADRFATPAEVVQALAPFARSAQPAPEPSEKASPPQAQLPQTSQSARRQLADVIRRPAALWSLLGLVATAVLFGVWWQRPDDQTSAKREPETTVKQQPGAPPTTSNITKVLLVVPHHNFWYPDYAEVAAAIESRPGVKFRVASSDLSPAQPENVGVLPVQVGYRLRDANPHEFDAVVFLGASRRDYLEFLSGQSAQPEAQRFIDDMLKQRKCVAGICAGIAVLADADALRDKPTAASQYAIRVAKSGSQAAWDSQRNVIADGLIVTAKDSSDAPELVDAMLQVISKRR